MPRPRARTLPRPVRSRSARPGTLSRPVGSRSAPPGTLRRIADLAEAGLVAPERRAELEAVAARYAVALTPHLGRLIDRGDRGDPIARQFLPDPVELERSALERDDPIGDRVHQPVKGIVHRYPDRVLLTPIHVCPVYCRFCFRREAVGPGGGTLRPAELAAALAYVRQRPAIREAILSGGDPLMLSAARLGALLRALGGIAHLEVLRIHTRLPVADPTAITPALVRALRTKKALYLVVHCNHPREVTPALGRAALRLLRAGIPVLAQSVLLRGVNDRIETLEALFRALLAARIKPYYLHHPDLAPGTAHFRLGLEQGQAIMRALGGRLSGLARPAYVLDLPGGFGKVPVGPTHASPGQDGGWTIVDHHGRAHAYRSG